MRRVLETEMLGFKSWWISDLFRPLNYKYFMKYIMQETDKNIELSENVIPCERFVGQESPKYL